MKIDYIKHGDYYLPDLEIPQERYEIGRFGRAYINHIKHNRKALYSQLMITGNLLKYADQIDKSAQQMYENIIEKMSKDAPPKENQMEWVGYMNNIRHTAEEIVLKEFIYEEECR